MMKLSYIYSLFICHHIIYITVIPMHVNLCPNTIHMLNSCDIGRIKLVLSTSPIFLLMRGASIEPLVDWETHDMFDGLVELPQGDIVFFGNMIDYFFSWECLKGSQTNGMGKIFICHRCHMLLFLGGQSNLVRDD